MSDRAFTVFLVVQVILLGLAVVGIVIAALAGPLGLTPR